MMDPPRTTITVYNPMSDQQKQWAEERANLERTIEKLKDERANMLLQIGEIKQQLADAEHTRNRYVDKVEAIRNILYSDQDAAHEDETGGYPTPGTRRVREVSEDRRGSAKRDRRHRDENGASNSSTRRNSVDGSEETVYSRRHGHSKSGKAGRH